jgi:prepilin-type N-terminal cleavage/methylation domain-containing protein
MKRHPRHPSAPETGLPHQNRGFTLIELLIVVVIIGILAAIAIPKFAGTKGKAEAASMREDLRNLATMQESYFYNNAIYSMSVTALQLNTSPNDNISISGATATGWSAVATNALATPGTCAVFYGSGTTPPPPATVEGEIACQ